MNLKDKLYDKVFVAITFEEAQKIAEETSIEYSKDELRLFVENTYLKKITEQSYVLSKSELLELKRQWVGDAFDVGHESRAKNTTVYANEFGVNARINQSEISKDKTQYINNITL